jgi:hypothetical protein
MRYLLFSTALLLVTCARGPASTAPMRGYDESIRFPKALPVGGMRLGGTNERLLIDGEIIQAIIVAAKDFIPSSSRSGCFTKPSDFFYGVLREGDIIFISISPDYPSCERGPWPMDWGAMYAISTDGRILRRADDEEPDEPPPPLPSDAGESGDGGYRRTGELSDFAHVFSAPVDDPPYFTRPEWRAQHWPRSRLHDGGSPDGGTSDGGTSDGGTSDGGTSDGGSPAIPPKLE